MQLIRHIQFKRAESIAEPAPTDPNPAAAEPAGNVCPAGKAETVAKPRFSIAGKISSSIRVDGDLILNESVCIEGEVFGGVSAEPGVLVWIGGGGIVHGQVKAEYVMVDGEALGGVEADCVIARSSARIKGGIRYRRIRIDDGAQLEGEIGPVASTASG
ncbi:MAG: hypothetical protein DI596_00395 [Azospira oryzae]|nr:MAG: hypothetical protein DI596_00395 [Azospira oryzae]PZP82991.1 MAG: hypothetical protein DI593_00395 [Azospira oryzae]